MMNIFEQVFASVDPKSNPKEGIENKPRNHRNSAEKTLEEIATTPTRTGRSQSDRVTFVMFKKSPSPHNKKRKSLLSQMREMKKRIEDDEEEDIIDPQIEKYQQLQKEIKDVNGKIKSVTNSLRLAETQNRELMERDSELGAELNQATIAVEQAHEKVEEIKIDLSVEDEEREANWQFRVDEILMEMECLKTHHTTM